MTEVSALRKAIISQPQVMRDLLGATHATCGAAGRILASAGRVFVAGTGSSSHAAVVGEHLLRSVDVEAHAATSFDLALYPRPLRATDALIVISHTGGTQYGAALIQRAKRAGATVIGITRDQSSMQGDDIRVSTGPNECSDTYTVSYTASLAALAALAVEAGRARGVNVSVLNEALERLPDDVADVLATQLEVEPVAVAAAERGRVILLGAGPNAITGREGALKIKESSYITAEGFELETAIHGGLAAVEPGDIAVVVLAVGPAERRLRDAAGLLAHIGARVWLIVDKRLVPQDTARDSAVTHEWFIAYPAVPEPLSPALAVVPLQLFAARIAEIRGTNPDNFKFDVPEFKQAYASITL